MVQGKTRQRPKPKCFLPPTRSTEGEKEQSDFEKDKKAVYLSHCSVEPEGVGDAEAARRDCSCGEASADSLTQSME